MIERWKGSAGPTRKWMSLLLSVACVMGGLSASATQPGSYVPETMPPGQQMASRQIAVVEAIGAEAETVPPGHGMAQAEATHRQILMRYMRSYNARLTPPQLQYLADAILRISAEYNVDYRIVASIIAVESSFRHDAVSSSGAIGLGQLKPSTARWLGVNNPYHPAENIAGLTRYISWLLRKYRGNMNQALSAYYQGPGTVDRHGITPACQPYLAKISTAMSRFP